MRRVGPSIQPQAYALGIGDSLPKRNAVKPHPIAELMPAMSATEFDSLKSDIAAHGVREPIWMYEGMVLDGRHRERACSELEKTCPAQIYDGDDPHAFVVSLNIHRRHLTTPQRRDVIAKLLKATPEKSDRAIADLARSDHKTVAAVRAVISANGEIPHKTERKETSGRNARGRKPNGSQPPVKEKKTPSQSRAERIPEIARLIAAGYSVKQIAQELGVTVANINTLMKENNVARPALIKSRGNNVNHSRLIGQTVSGLSGMAQGIQLLRNGGLHVPRSDAAVLYAEATEALRNIHWIVAQLKEIANGKRD